MIKKSKKVKKLYCDLYGVPEEGMPMGTAMLMYTGVGAVSVVVPLVLIGLGLLIMMRFKKKGETYFNDAVQF